MFRRTLQLHGYISGGGSHYDHQPKKIVDKAYKCEIQVFRNDEDSRHSLVGCDALQ